ncbi:unnamed protein product [Chilo suppressalis]|uniref:Peptidase S1 domain-containing protein n=1 Tax=Chilo suppressalis TaxID=168631 RepID=A0ABN8L5J9_CHISP|nr:unnamed protein product [Chilo suppressalis]
MYFGIVLPFLFITSSSWSKQITENRHHCSGVSEFTCEDGSCVPLSRYCDGINDCNDSSDEATCYIGESPEQLVLQRAKKQVPQVLCRNDEWSCRDGTCISYGGKCNGVIDCPDGSDETALMCDMNNCDESQFRCSYGACVANDAPCNGVPDCADNSDELMAYCSNNQNDTQKYEEEMRNMRHKRQATCGKAQWKCRDGSCISVYGKCDGMKDCADGSDETFALCRKTPLKTYKKPSGSLYKNLEKKLWKEHSDLPKKVKVPIRCQSNWFRCTYGACVDGTAPCNNVQECADNSDELLRRCRNQTEEVRGTFTCDNGKEIPAFAHCDGAKDCTDGSDETVKACAGKTCASYLFQCAYGACVDQGSDCDNKEDCADGSDESDELCNKTSTVTPPVVPLSGGSCRLPPYPANGHYVVSNVRGAVPGQSFYSVGLNVTCNPGYGLASSAGRLCVDGVWQPHPVRDDDCVRFCRLNKDPSVTYRCLLTGNSDGTRECTEYEPAGTIVRPDCNTPNYYYPGVLPYMRCIDGNWDYVARCNAECGRVVPKGIDLIIGGRPAERGELPWHTGIYRKTTTPYMQICGGSLVSAKVVISAAHCFWNDTHKALPASNYAVALGKLYRPWAYSGDQDVQRSDVAQINLSPYFQGGTANFQDDIAIMLLASVIEFRPHIRPVCVSFNVVFESRQLSPGNKGKVAGWGLTEENGNASPFLKVVELPFISIQECQTDAPLDFREYITGDKFCAGFRNGTALCKGDSGGGLTFPDQEQGNTRYYLRGVVSTAPNNDNLCNAYWLTTFTQISRHEHFIKNYL